MEQVRLPDLEVIKRFSIAVRKEHAPAEEVIAALEADLAEIKRLSGKAVSADSRAAATPRSASTKRGAPAGRTPAKTNRPKTTRGRR